MKHITSIITVIFLLTFSCATQRNTATSPASVKQAMMTEVTETSLPAVIAADTTDTVYVERILERTRLVPDTALLNRYQATASNERRSYFDSLMNAVEQGTAASQGAAVEFSVFRQEISKRLKAEHQADSLKAENIRMKPAAEGFEVIVTSWFLVIVFLQLLGLYLDYHRAKQKRKQSQ